MERSTEIGELSAALALAQGQFTPAEFNRINPHFKNRYADLASIMGVIRAPLASVKVALTQSTRTEANAVCVTTMLSHSSGQWMSETLCLPVGKFDAQGVGSALTYARRYAICALLGVVADDDDDANAAVSNPPPGQRAAPAKPEEPAKPHPSAAFMAAVTKWANVKPEDAKAATRDAAKKLGIDKDKASPEYWAKATAEVVALAKDTDFGRWITGSDE